jgi:uncharacterized protein (TIGR02271 family)
MSPVADFPTVITREGAHGRVESESPETQDGELKVLVNFENGERLWVPADRLILQEEGNFLLSMSLEELSLQLTRPTVAARPADLDAAFSSVQAPAPTDAIQAAPALPAEPSRPAPQQPPTPPAAPPAEGEAPSAPADGELEVPDFTSPPADLLEPPASGLDHVQVSRVVESIREDVGAPLLREEVDIHRVPVNEYVDAAPPIRYEDDRVIIPVLEEVLQVEKRLLLREEVVITKRRSQVPGEQRQLRQVTEVIAAPAAAGAAQSGPADAYHQHYESQRFPGARGFAYYEPAYHFGELLRTSARYRDWPWERLEPEARALWERDNPGTWSSVQPAVRYAWSGAHAAV